MNTNQQKMNPAELESFKRQNFLENYVNENLNFSYTSGSRLYGTNIESSDTDIRGVFLHSADKYFSISKEDHFTEVIFKGDEDKVIYEFNNFATMLKEQNPSIIESLWIKDIDVIQDSRLFQTLRENKYELCAPIALDKMLGFAASQLKMAKKFEKKHFTKEMAQPQRVDFIKLISNPLNKNFGERNFPIENTCAVKHPEHPNFYLLYSSSYLSNPEHSWITENNFLFIKDKSLVNKEVLAIVEFRAEEFKQANLAYNNFLNWKENGNMSKLDIAQELGYQPKPMMHALRNLFMAKEFIETGDIILYRKEADFLKDVRTGKFSLNECNDFVKTLEEHIKSKKQDFSIPAFNENLMNEILRSFYLEKFSMTPTPSFILKQKMSV